MDPERDLAATAPSSPGAGLAAELWERLPPELPGHYRGIALLLRDGLTAGGIALRLGMKERTVRRVIQRILEHARRVSEGVR